jgi:L-alanine-DL-glutamate epimerase-like enolase superfamily enzyme
MIIANIETFPLRIPFKSGPQAAASAWGDKGLPVGDSLLVRVTTDQGLEGWGETFGFRAVSSAQLAIDELIARLCIGRDATQIGPLLLDVQKKLHVFGRSGPLFYGISAVDIAFWDAAGKATNTPVCRLLGGGAADLACYASRIPVPQRPGLGINPDPNVIRAYLRQVL